MNFKKFQVRWKEPLGLKECPYMYRWVFIFFDYAIRLHYWVASDDQRHFHDHPWWMYIFVLWGSYTDISPAGEDLLKIGSFRFREAEHKHTVKVHKHTLTLLFTGPKKRNWGFWVLGRDKILRPLRYFSRYKHHPCEDL